MIIKQSMVIDRKGKPRWTGDVGIKTEVFFKGYTNYEIQASDFICKNIYR